MGLLPSPTSYRYRKAAVSTHVPENLANLTRRCRTVETKEEQDEALGRFARGLVSADGTLTLAWRMVADGDGQREDIRNGLEVYPEAKALIQSLKEDGQWDTDALGET